MKMRAVIAVGTAVMLAGFHAIALAGDPEENMPLHGSDDLLLATGDGGIARPGGVLPVRTGSAPDVSREHWTVPTASDAMSMDLLGLKQDGKFHAGAFVTEGELNAAAARLVAKARAEWPARTRQPSAPERESFDPAADDLATRADLARVIAGVLCNLEPAATRLSDAMDAGTEIFYDVPEGDPRFEVIVAVRDLGLVRGYHDGGYHPEEPVLRMELAESLIWTWRYLTTLPDPAPSLTSQAPKPALETVPVPEEPLTGDTQLREHWTTDPGEDAADPMDGMAQSEPGTVRPADGEGEPMDEGEEGSQ